MHNKKSFICSLPLLMFGGMIYVLFRSRQTLLLKIADTTPLSHTLTDIRGAVASWQPSGWVVYSLPGALWAGAYVLIIHSLMHSLEPAIRWKWASVIPLLGVFSELGQAAGIVPGTFDMLDLAGYLLPLVIYSLYVKSIIQKHGQ